MYLRTPAAAAAAATVDNAKERYRYLYLLGVSLRGTKCVRTAGRSEPAPALLLLRTLPPRPQPYSSNHVPAVAVQTEI